MAMHRRLSQGDPPQGWPWEGREVAMYTTNLSCPHHYEREHLFEKPLTPSDVGKLNRLVIPKQHAERYFPLRRDSAATARRVCSSPSRTTTTTTPVLLLDEQPELRAHQGLEPELVECMVISTEEAAASSYTSTSSPERNMWLAPPGLADEQFAGESHRDADTRSSGAAAAPPSSRRLRLFGVNVDCGPAEPEADQATTATSLYGCMHHQSPYAAVSTQCQITGQ
ncbi:hypothetical protein GUJ93_ZPchr0009g2319 [Zizania palustris]|uniref:Uncharacterized protein n=1 Tax=Zizania palustris TaxID=103762 RepID=A0A8J5S5J9_ZIZPA|nr:hypothetical protein GUJ93_ZPchr0009g2319 [Zizania palustris]